jgi:SP family arabinose:H+ symporter-like MFS transporter
MKSLYANLIASVAALGGFLFGYDTAIINGALIFLKREFALSDVATEWAAGSLLGGCIGGTAIAGWLADRFGRKWILLSSAALFAIAAIGAAEPHTLNEFVVARIAGGIAIGLVSTLVPVYIAEIAPAAARGRMVSFYQLAIVIGILAAYLASAELAGFGAASWRWMFLTAALPSAVFFIALLFVPESPRWLVQRSRKVDALAILSRIETPALATEHLRDIEHAMSEENGSFTELINPVFRPALIVGAGLACLCQITGINTILYYGAILFTEHTHGGSQTSALRANVTIGIINLAATLVTLAIIDSWGRKKLLLTSSGGMAAALGLLGCALGLHWSGTIALICVLAFVAFFAIGMGPIPWVLIAEIFPARIRGRAASVCTIVLWSSCLLVTVTFLSLIRAAGAAATFELYAALSALTFFFIVRAVPETKGKTLEEIQERWQQTSRLPDSGRLPEHNERSGAQPRIS